MTDSLRILPCTLRQAQAFVQDEHRTHNAAQGGLWALALMRGEELVGVAIAGRPVSASLQAKGYCEVIRVAVIEGRAERLLNALRARPPRRSSGGIRQVCDLHVAE